jgi:3-oxoacyl-[acyl-carrier protein] reductase
MSVNVDGVYYTTKALLPEMIERGRGHLVFVSSVLGRKGVPNMSAYTASKAAVAAFAESVAAEVKPHGVKVTVVYPGTTATTMREHQARRPKTPDITDPELQLAPEDVADAIAWATRVSDRAYPTAVTVEPRGLAADPRTSRNERNR